MPTVHSIVPQSSYRPESETHDLSTEQSLILESLIFSSIPFLALRPAMKHPKVYLCHSTSFSLPSTVSNLMEEVWVHGRHRAVSPKRAITVLCLSYMNNYPSMYCILSSQTRTWPAQICGYVSHVLLSFATDIAVLASLGSKKLWNCSTQNYTTPDEPDCCHHRWSDSLS